MEDVKQKNIKRKLNYEAPKLVRYGDLRAVVQAKTGGNNLDGQSQIKMNGGIRLLKS